MAILRIDIGTGEVLEDISDRGPDTGNPCDFDDKTPLPFDIRDIGGRMEDIVSVPTTDDKPQPGRDFEVPKDLPLSEIEKPYRPPYGKA